MLKENPQNACQTCGSLPPSRICVHPLFGRTPFCGLRGATHYPCGANAATSLQLSQMVKTARQQRLLHLTTDNRAMSSLLASAADCDQEDGITVRPASQRKTSDIERVTQVAHLALTSGTDVGADVDEHATVAAERSLSNFSLRPLMCSPHAGRMGRKNYGILPR